MSVCVGVSRGQATAVTAGAQAAAETAAGAAMEGGGAAAGAGSGVALAGGVGHGGSGETMARAFELYKLSHNIKKMLGETRWPCWSSSPARRACRGCLFVCLFVWNLSKICLKFV